MSDDEPIDVLTATGERLLDPDGRPIRRRRADVHREGLWHAAFHLWVRTPRGLLFQRRSPDKASWPSALDATAAGHLLAGESVLDGLREVEEELGVRYEPARLRALGTFRVEDPAAGPGVNREHQHVFLVDDDRPLESWTEIDRRELAGLVLVAPEPAAELMRSADSSADAIEWDGEAGRPVRVVASELVPASYLEQLARTIASLPRRAATSD